MKLSIISTDVLVVLNRILANWAAVSERCCPDNFQVDVNVTRLVIKACKTLARFGNLRIRMIGAGISTALIDMLADTYETKDKDIRTLTCESCSVLG